MTNYDLLPDLKEWAESYEAVEIGIDGVLYAVINYIEDLEARLKKSQDMSERRWAVLMAIHDVSFGKSPDTSKLLWPSFVTDIQKRIEELEITRQHYLDCYTRKVQHELKVRARIEKLEAALRSIAVNTCCENCQEDAKVARAALGEKKDG